MACWFNTGKTQLVLFDQSNNTGAIDVKMDWPFLEEKSSSEMLGLYFSSKLDCRCYVVSIAKTASKEKLETWFTLWNFFLLRLPFISINLPYSLAWNNVMSGLVLLTVTWKCWISDKNVTGVLGLHFLKSFR